MNENDKLVGRKLYLKWGDHMYISIEKIPDGDRKLLEMDLAGNPEIMLCNVYENRETGKLSEEILGPPADSRSGYPIDIYFTMNKFWKTPSEYLE